MSKKLFLSDWLSFLKDKNHPPGTNSKLHSLQTTFQTVCISLFIAVIVGIFSSYIMEIVGFSTANNYTVVNDLSKLPAWQSLGLLVFIGPFLEEIAFRFLLLPKKHTIIFGSLFFLIYLGQAILGILPISINLLAPIFLFYIVFLITISVIIFFKLRTKKVIGFWERNSLTLIYFCSAIFATMHAFNYNNIVSYFYLVPVLVLPQFIVGLNMSYLRLKHGFVWCLIGHSSYNAILSLTIPDFFTNSTLKYAQIALGVAIVTVLSTVVYLVVQYLVEYSKPDRN